MDWPQAIATSVFYIVVGGTVCFLVYLDSKRKR